MKIRKIEYSWKFKLYTDSDSKTSRLQTWSVFQYLQFCTVLLNVYHAYILQLY